MKCPRCQAKNPPGMKFCGQCAAPLAAICPSCGASNPPGNKFCRQCATSLSKPAAPRFTTPDAYSPKHLAEKILSSKSALEGERKHVTVLFADLKGSMELLADRDPEEARKILDPVLERMMEAVHRYEGTVNQVMGDGIMALFGAPLAHEDHAVRACYAALRTQESVKRYAEQVHRTEGVPIQVRVGLNSGEVVVRSIGSDLHMDYTAVGQTTHVAARLEQMTMPGSVLISPATLALAEGYVVVKPLGLRPIKGLERPLELYELVGATTVRSRFQAAAARGLTRFVGRESELDQLRQAVERARAGHGQVVAVVGEPGIGKSRLYWEFSHSHGVQGWLILESGSVSYGKPTNYLPIIELLRAYFQIQHADDTRKIREKVTGRLLSLDRQLEPCVTPILWLLDVPMEDETWERLDPPQRRLRVLDGVKRLLLRESQIQPVMVLFEDLHWIDAETQALLENLVESLPTARLLLLVNYRPEYGHGWGSKTYYRQIQVDPLPVESAKALLDALLGSDAPLAPLKRLVIERTEGNPFFVEESVRSLVEMGVLAGERGAYRLTRVVQDLQVPATAQAMLAARIDRLSPEDKRLLQAAAVIGTDVPFELLQAVADESEDRLRRGLAQLQATEFLYETRLFPDLEYTFRHVLTHEVAYGSLLAERRRALHARIVSAIEALYGDRPDGQIERLAHHALHGELWAKAVAYLRQAGDRAMMRSANHEAAAYLEEALEGLRRLPKTRETVELAIDLRLDLRTALFRLAEFARMESHLQEAEALARSLGDQRRLGELSARKAVQRVNAGDYYGALSSAREALAIAEALGDRSVETRALSQLGAVHNVRGEFREAADFLERNVARLEGDLLQEQVEEGTVQMAAFSRAYLADALSELGRFDQAIAHGEAAVRIAEAADHPYALHFGLFDLGLTHLRRGDAARATPLLERCLDLCRASQIVIARPLVAAALGAAYAFADRLAEARSPITEALEEFRRHPLYRRPGLILVLAGLSYLRAGRIDETVGCVDEALALTRRLGARGSEAHALRLLGEVAECRACPEAGEEHYRQALDLANELGMRPLVAHCHLGLGKLYRRKGKPKEAQEHLTTATTMYREMDMRSWLEQAETESRP
jgi:class 3 adenylate cyclase/tetratricopeptide (TPR) repeat protein